MAMSESSPMIELRPATGADRLLLERVYASTRTEELGPVPWSDDQKRSFLKWQFDARDTDYRRNYRRHRLTSIVCDGADAGRLYVDRRADEIRIVDIALLPRFRGGGVGTLLVERLLREGNKSARPVSIHVERNNRALGLYRRLGFELASDGGVYLLMRWTPPGAAGQPNTAS